MTGEQQTQRFIIVLKASAVHYSGHSWCLMRQWGRLFVLMAAVLPTVMNSLDDAPPCSIDHTLSRRRRMEIGPGGESKEVHTCLHLLWTHMDAGISTHVHTERARGCASMCVCVWWRSGSGWCVFIDSRGCSLPTGPRMIFLLVTVWSI